MCIYPEAPHTTEWLDVAEFDADARDVLTMLRTPDPYYPGYVSSYEPQGPEIGALIESLSHGYDTRYPIHLHQKMSGVWVINDGMHRTIACIIGGTERALTYTHRHTEECRHSPIGN